MERHTATYDIESRSDARTAARAIEELYDRLREENRTVAGDEPESEAVAEFEALRAAIDAEADGSLVVTYRPAEAD